MKKALECHKAWEEDPDAQFKKCRKWITDTQKNGTPAQKRKVEAFLNVLRKAV